MGLEKKGTRTLGGGVVDAGFALSDTSGSRGPGAVLLARRPGPRARGGHVGRAFVTSGAGVVSAFAAGLALFTVGSLAVIYLWNANVLSPEEEN